MRRKVTIDHDLDPDFSWLEQDRYDPSHPSYDPVFRTLREVRRYSALKAISPERARAYAEKYAHHDYNDPSNHVALVVTIWEEDEEGNESGDGWRVLDSVGNVDFLHDSDDWSTGTWYYISDMPKSARYLRHLAREMGLRYRRRPRRAR